MRSSKILKERSESTVYCQLYLSQANLQCQLRLSYGQGWTGRVEGSGKPDGASLPEGRPEGSP